MSRLSERQIFSDTNNSVMIVIFLETCKVLEFQMKFPILLRITEDNVIIARKLRRL